jgi:hypothetical protein
MIFSSYFFSPSIYCSEGCVNYSCVYNGCGILRILSNNINDRAMAQAVSRRPPTAEARVRSRPIPVAERSKAWVFGRSLAGIVGSNHTGGMDVCVVL